MTAGNASGINDAGAALVHRDGSGGARARAQATGELVSWGVVGVDPTIMGIGPAPAIRQALKRADLTLDQLDRVEVNEAFSAQYLAVEKDLGWTATRPTSTAARSRWVIRWPPAARAWRSR